MCCLRLSLTKVHSFLVSFWVPCLKWFNGRERRLNPPSSKFWPWSRCSVSGLWSHRRTLFLSSTLDEQGCSGANWEGQLSNLVFILMWWWHILWNTFADEYLIIGSNDYGILQNNIYSITQSGMCVKTQKKFCLSDGIISVVCLF